MRVTDGVDVNQFSDDVQKIIKDQDYCLDDDFLRQITKPKRREDRVDMLTLKDKIEQFKRDCRINEYYTKAILDCNERIEELDVKLNGLGCPNGSTEPKCENAGNPYKPNKIEPIMLQDQIKLERNEYIKKMNFVNGMLMKITNPTDRQMIVDLYIENKNHQYVADKYHYASRMALYKHVNKVLEKLFTSNKDKK